MKPQKDVEKRHRQGTVEPSQALHQPTHDQPGSLAVQLTALLAATTTAACTGGGTAVGGGGTGDNPSPITTPTPSPLRAAKFLAQASMGGGIEEINTVRDLGFETWLEKQFAMQRTVPSLFQWLREKGYEELDSEQFFGDTQGVDNAVWRSLILSEDTLRQRVAFALSQIFVVSFVGVTDYFRTFALAAYMDLLIDHAFGNYRDLLEAVSRNPAMGQYLSFVNNKKASADGTQLPDENYAREVMQLFSIGLYELNPDGTPKLALGNPIETYDQDDVMGLARVLTGWVWDKRQSRFIDDPSPTRVTQRRPANATYWQLPMIQNAAWYETGSKAFLGVTIPANTKAEDSLKIALDTLYNHPNVGPFLGTQLIQRLVKSNPSPAYVQRITEAFNTGKFRTFGSGKRGDLKAVIAAILLDAEARTDGTSPDGQKLREPVLRFTHWARTFKLNDPEGQWNIGDLTTRASRLGQSPLRSSSVFNFFRPGYIPPGTQLASKKLRAPEFQITDEVSVAGYVNFMQRCISAGVPKMGSNPVVYYPVDYSRYQSLAATPKELLAELNLVLAAGRLTTAQLGELETALSTIPATNDTGKLNRVKAAITLIMAAPEFIVLN